MPTLLRPWKRPTREEPPDQDAHLELTRQKQAGPLEAQDLLLLIPTDGGLSFRLFRFPGKAAAAAFLAKLASSIDPYPRHIAFRALHSRTPGSENEATEAVVLIRDAQRPGIVDLYSFVDMESADAYVRQEAAEMLDLSLVLMYWAQPVKLVLPDQTTAQRLEMPEPAVAAISLPLPPRPVQPSVHRTVAACPTEPVADSRVRVKVTPPGAILEAATPQADANIRPPSVWSGLVAQIQAWGGWDGLAPLLAKAALLNENVYHDFDEDPYATGRGRLVLGLALLAAAIGAAGSGPASMLVHVPAFALGWAAFALTVYTMGTQAFPGRRSPETLPKLVRVLGLATAPALLLVMGVVPVYGPLFVLAAYIWLLLTTATAVAGPLELNRDSSLILATVGCLVLFTVSQVAPLLLT